MNLLFWGITLGTLGKVMVAIAVIFAHHKLAEERKVDKKVIQSFQNEKIVTILGLILILLGYAMEVYFYGFATEILTCQGAACTSAVSNAFGL
jgi:hypothetical protein